MKVYFAHDIRDYNNQSFEDRCISRINLSLKGRNDGCKIEIINPKDYSPIIREKYEDEMRKIFYPLIKSCDLIYPFKSSNKQANYRNGYTKGVTDEINFALNNKIQVKELDKIRYNRTITEMKIYNSVVYKFLLSFFEMSKGVRVRSRQLSRQNSPMYYDKGNNTSNLVTLMKNNIMGEMIWGTSHFMSNIFDNSVLLSKNVIDLNNHERKIFFESKIIGVQSVFDVDAPKNPKAKLDINEPLRLNFFDYIEDFKESSKIIERMLDDAGEEFNVMFSGNGIYFVLKVFDDTEMLDDYLYDVSEDISKINRRINDKLNIVKRFDLREGESIPFTVDEDKAGWSRYYKLPFTRHWDYPRLCIPIMKNWYDDIEHLDKMSNVGNYKSINQIFENTKNIIEKANWKNLW